MRLKLEKLVVSPILTLINIKIGDDYIDDIILNDDGTIDYETLNTNKELKKINDTIIDFAKSTKEYQVYDI